MKAKHIWAFCALASVAALVSLGWRAQDMGWLRVARVSSLPAELRAPLGQDAQTAPDIAAITAFAPFGATVAPPAEQARASTPSARAPLTLVLRGIMADADPARSRALISDGATTASYRVGEDVAEGAEVVRIGARTVTLDRDGARFVLSFDGLAADGSDTPAAPVAQAPEAATDPLLKLAAAVRQGRGSLDLRDAPPPETVDGYIDMWRTRIRQDPVAVMETIGVERTGRGYRIKPDPDIGVTLAGLRPGDLVTRLNGQAVGHPDRDRALYDEVAAAGVARLEVERSGETLLMTFSLR